MADQSSGLTPDYETSQSIYDLNDDFFALFLGPTMGYTCAYFERDDMTLDEAQVAKFDLALGKLNLEPGMTLLDIGCGWGGALELALAALRRQRHRNHVEPQPDLDHGPAWRKCRRPRIVEVRLQGWEEFDEPVDRIVSIGAFERSPSRALRGVLRAAHRDLPADGRMLLHTIIGRPQSFFARQRNGDHHERSAVHAVHRTGDLSRRRTALRRRRGPVRDRGRFRRRAVHSLCAHYARTLDMWAANLEAKRDEAIAITDEANYDRFMRYLTGCADFFRRSITDIAQFTLVKG